MLCKALKDFKANTEVNVPIFLKLTSDLELDGFKNILPAITETFDGMILANTTRKRDGLTSSNKVEDGGLSGQPLSKEFRVSEMGIPTNKWKILNYRHRRYI